MCNARSTTTPFIKKNEPSASSFSISEPVQITAATAVGAPEAIEFDISNLSAEDLQSLKQEDPFLYYSIPAVRRTTFNFEEPDLSGSSLEESTTTTIKRCTRVSFERPADLQMEDLLGDLEEDHDQFDMEHIQHQFSRLFGMDSQQ